MNICINSFIKLEDFLILKKRILEMFPNEEIELEGSINEHNLPLDFSILFFQFVDYHVDVKSYSLNFIINNPGYKIEGCGVNKNFKQEENSLFTLDVGKKHRALKNNETLDNCIILFKDYKKFPNVLDAFDFQKQLIELIEELR